MEYTSHALRSTSAACIVTEIHALAFSCNTAFLNQSQICTLMRNKEKKRCSEVSWGAKWWCFIFSCFWHLFWMGKLGIFKVWLMNKLARSYWWTAIVSKIGSKKVTACSFLWYNRYCRHSNLALEILQIL